MERIKIGITHGYTNGVGYEVILKAFEEPTLLELCTPIVYGSPKVASYHRKALGLNTNFTTIQHAEEALENRLNIVECIQEEVKVDLGQKTEEADRATTISIDAAKRGLAAKHFDAQVMAPGDKMSTANGTTILINERTRVALLTDNISFSDVSKHITSEEVSRKIADLDRCLKRDFAISGPRIAVLALNPEPGEEEQNIIKPAIEQAGDKHIFAMGPFAADTFFGSQAYLHYDGILAMYHDQGYIPFQVLTNEYAIVLHSAEESETLTAAPLEDAQLAIAGKGEADITAFCNAIYTVTDVLRNREHYDEAHQNPLPKLFHDKREDNRRNTHAEALNKTEEEK